MKKSYLLLFLLGITLLNACKKKEDDPVTPTSGFSANKLTVTVDEEVQFTNTSDNATAFNWSFGDGTTSTEVAPKKTYSTSDNYTVTLVATGAGGSDIATIIVKVLPLCAFTVENESSLIAGTPVQFTNGSKGATSYQWSFGDALNSTATGLNPTFTYAASGTYTVTLKAISAAGESTFSKTVTVGGAPVVKDLYFIEYGNTLIKKLALDGSTSAATVLDISGKAGAGMAYDAVNKKIYFSDFEVTGTGNIWRMNPDGTDLSAIASNLTDPYGVAVDPVGGKVYWVDDLGNVSRANLDGSSPEIGLVNVPGGQMRAIALDVENNKMYFYEVNVEVLYVANLDGSNVTPLLTGTYGYAILVDTVNDKLYYDDQNANKLWRVNLDGTNPETIDADGTRIYGMFIDYSDNKLYWSGRDSGKIVRSNLDGSAPETLLSTLASPRGIALIQ
jgi:PKD repeat protein